MTSEARILVVLDIVMALVASGHAVLYKRDTRAAIGWAGLIWLAPFIGTGLYVLLGINRIQRKATRLRRDLPSPETYREQKGRTPGGLRKALGSRHDYLRALAGYEDRVTVRALLSGNRIVPLTDGDAAFAAMLAAIDSARTSVALATYIFEEDRIGKIFIAALAGAVRRGLQVRVLVDDIGARYGRAVLGPLRKAGVETRTFMPPRIAFPWRIVHTNLRLHRKILVADGAVGFAGGMNIREGHCRGAPHAIEDVHFRVEGPVVSQMVEVFAQDWTFTTGEHLAGDAWFPVLEEAGKMLARGIADGPDEDYDKIRMTLLGALGCARQRVRIVTPYFLPDATLIAAMQVAALRGVEVDVLLPEVCNLRLVQWASTALLWQLLEYGCRIWYTPLPFDHSKLALVDGCWSLVGSSNLDPRSLRLNFEFNLAIYDRSLARQLDLLIDAKLARARPVTLADVDARWLPVRLRDGLARLFSPYL